MKQVLVLALISMAAMTSQAFSRYTAYPLVGGYAVNELCDAGASFHTSAPRNVCLKAEVKTGSGDQYIGNEIVCVERAMQVQDVSKQVTTTKCLDKANSGNNVGDLPNYPVQGSIKCVNEVSSVSTLGNTFTATIIEDRGEVGSVAVGTVSYTVQACAKTSPVAPVNPPVGL